jgi:hypothetical protein
MVLAIKIIAVFVLGVVGVSYLFSRLTTNPPRWRATWPTDASLEWTPRKLVSLDGTELEGILVRIHSGKGIVVIVHGAGDYRKSLWLVHGAAHCQPYSVAREAYQARVLDFLENV